MKRKTKQPAKKPRTLNAVWADAVCWNWPDPGDERITRVIECKVHSELTSKQALRLSKWLAEAAAWKGEE